MTQWLRPFIIEGPHPNGYIIATFDKKKWGVIDTKITRSTRLQPTSWVIGQIVACFLSVPINKWVS
ncbi:MAG: hypothetical protein R2788_12775 [Saprospiraceae bacterium]